MDTQITPTKWVSLSISRGPIRGPLRNVVGCIVHVVADPSVEEFMRNASRDVANDDPALYDSRWYPLSNGPLHMYKVSGESLGVRGYDYSLDYPGSDLQIQRKVRSDMGLSEMKLISNLSFLRLVGISKPEGVKFGVFGAFGEEHLHKVSNKLLQATKLFLKDFIVPVDVSWQIVSK